MPGAMKRFEKPNTFWHISAVAVLQVEGALEPSRRVGHALTYILALIEFYLLNNEASYKTPDQQ